MATVSANGLAESATDPVLNACQWYGADLGQENGDKCAWQWGTTYTSANGARANVPPGASAGAWEKVRVAAVAACAARRA